MLFNSGWYFKEFELDTPFSDMFTSNDLYPVSIPHDWMIYHVKDLYKNSIGFYKKTFSLDPEENHTYLIRFEGAYMDTRVFCNGVQAYEWKYGYSTFEVDLTPFLVSGENTVCVTCTYQSPNTRWYSGAGLYRNVYFLDKNPSFFPSDGSYIHMSKEQEDFTVTIDIEAKSIIPANATIKHSVFDADGNTVLVLQDDLTLSDSISVNTQKCLIQNPRLWDINNPYLYSVTSELYVNGQIMDSITNPLGFRTFSFDPDKGFILNGRNVKINGVCQHHDLGALGSAMNKVALRRQFKKLMAMGVNSIRTSHNMPAVEVMELADEMGLLIYSESFDMWELPKTTYDYGNFFPTWYEKDVESWIRRDRNHPSLIIWGIGNEIYDTHAGNGLKWTRLLRDAVKKYDPYHNAYIGIGSNYIEWENAQKCSDELDLSGYNYGERLYDEHHKKYPHWCIFGSETASTVQSRGIYHFPYEIRILTYQDGQCSCLGNCTTNWGAKNAAFVIAAHRDRDFVSGQYLWSGFDYIGEPTPYHSKNSFFGQIDTAGFEKDTFYQYQAEWTDAKENPMVHLLPYWDFNEGQIIDVCAYSNAPYVELFFNGTSLGKQYIDHENGYDLQGHWKVPYKKGEILVKAYDEEGNVIATDSQKSFEDPASINVTADKTTLLANGLDLSFLEISLDDLNGNYVANARNRIYIEVEGPGHLAGLDNGDSTDYEEYKGSNRRLFQGKLLAIIASDTCPGNITVKIFSEGLPSKSIILTAVESESVTTEVCPILCNKEAPTADIPVRKIELSCKDSFTLTKEKPTAQVTFSLLPKNCTYKDIYFRCLTKDAVDANFAKVDVTDNIATITALGDGEFTLTAFCNNDKDHAEIISTLNFSVEGMGLATHNPYEMIPGIQYSSFHAKEAKLSFLGGVFLAPIASEPSYITYDNVDFGEFGSDEIHIPVFSFHDEIPVEIWEGDYLTGQCLCKGMYKAKSIYNTYQENCFKLSQRIKGTTSITLVFFSTERFSVQGFYFTKITKAYACLSALDNTRITGDSYSIEEDAITGIGNNVCIEYEGMDFTKGLSSVIIIGRSHNPITSLHLFFEGDSASDIQLVEIPGSLDYEKHSFYLKNCNIKGKVNLVFLPGSNFDLKSIQFLP